ncbi:MAG: bifunctional precorrin-2 dehydrogenase/sirohydrochlorin ferrochelatase [Desulfobacteraceae bacterium]|nr:bifunctional precorrin-2 dehydrogenase/sirohydrochlorin ferrochelatase [Desulfobacteraceae bacterium]
MPHLPLNIDVRGKIALVVGGGNVAETKITSLLAAGATTNIVAPQITPEITRLVAEGAVKYKAGCYESCDLHDVFLAVAATNDPETNHRVAVDARQSGMLVVVADDPKSGNCSFPALLRRGDLEITVSTNGTCPGFATVVRDILASVIGEEYDDILTTLAAEREKLLTEGGHSTYNREILRSRARELINKLAEHKERVP